MRVYKYQMIKNAIAKMDLNLIGRFCHFKWHKYLFARKITLNADKNNIIFV